MEKRNLRKERVGVVSSNKGDKTITVAVKYKENIQSTASSSTRRRNITLTTRRMSAM